MKFEKWKILILNLVLLIKIIGNTNLSNNISLKNHIKSKNSNNFPINHSKENNKNHDFNMLVLNNKPSEEFLNNNEKIIIENKIKSSHEDNNEKLNNFFDIDGINNFPPYNSTKNSEEKINKNSKMYRLNEFGEEIIYEKKKEIKNLYDNYKKINKNYQKRNEIKKNSEKFDKHLEKAKLNINKAPGIQGFLSIFNRDYPENEEENYFLLDLKPSKQVIINSIYDNLKMDKNNILNLKQNEIESNFTLINNEEKSSNLNEIKKIKKPKTRLDEEKMDEEFTLKNKGKREEKKLKMINIIKNRQKIDEKKIVNLKNLSIKNSTIYSHILNNIIEKNIDSKTLKNKNQLYLNFDMEISKLKDLNNQLKKDDSEKTDKILELIEKIKILKKENADLKLKNFNFEKNAENNNIKKIKKNSIDNGNNTNVSNIKCLQICNELNLDKNKTKNLENFIKNNSQSNQVLFSENKNLIKKLNTNILNSNEKSFNELIQFKFIEKKNKIIYPLNFTVSNLKNKNKIIPQEIKVNKKNKIFESEKKFLHLTNKNLSLLSSKTGIKKDFDEIKRISNQENHNFNSTSQINLSENLKISKLKDELNKTEYINQNLKLISKNLNVKYQQIKKELENKNNENDILSHKLDTCINDNNNYRYMVDSNLIDSNHILENKMFNKIHNSNSENFKRIFSFKSIGNKMDIQENGIKKNIEENNEIKSQKTYIDIKSEFNEENNILFKNIFEINNENNESLNNNENLNKVNKKDVQGKEELMHVPAFLKNNNFKPSFLEISSEIVNNSEAEKFISHFENEIKNDDKEKIQTEQENLFEKNNVIYFKRKNKTKLKNYIMERKRRNHFNRKKLY